jgi:hypothetical protein
MIQRWNILTGIEEGRVLGAVAAHSKRSKQGTNRIYGAGESAQRVIENILSFLT